MLQDLPKCERPREKLISQGVSNLSNTELIALLISSGSQDESAIQLASRILSMEKSGLSKFSDYEPEEFMKLKGVGIAKACTLVAAIELGKRISSGSREDRILCDNPENMANIFMDDMRYLKQELIKVALVDTHMRLIAKFDVSKGDESSAMACPKDIFRIAVKKGAHGIVLAHNHPSGNSGPSDADFDVTRKAIESGRILGIRLVDHLIIGDDSFYSFRQKNPEMFD